MNLSAISLARGDFGSGHASYGYIERLPADYVKMTACSSAT